MRPNELAAYFHKRMCDDERFGYSWEERYGAIPEIWRVDGRDYFINIGDYECGTSCKTAWALAFQGTPYEGCLDGYVYTGNAIETFCGTGLFEWKPMSFLAEPGDLYLSIEHHLAMCQTQVPDILSEFTWGDNGAYGNQRGDQSGEESHVRGWYDYPWDGILHYVGPASFEAPKAWPLHMYTSNGTAAQRFSVIHRDDGYVTLKCVADGRCIDVAGAQDASQTPVQLYEDNGTKAQLWKFVRKAKTPDGGVYVPEEAAPYEIFSAVSDKLCLDVQGASDEPGAKVWLYERNNTTAQEWYRLDNGDGTWTLVNNATGKKLCLDCVGGGK